MHDDTGRGLVMDQGLLLGTQHFFRGFVYCIKTASIKQSTITNNTVSAVALLSSSRGLSIVAETQLPWRAVRSLAVIQWARFSECHCNSYREC